MRYRLALIILICVVCITNTFAQDALTFVPFTNDTFGLQGQIPNGWTEVAPGVYGDATNKTSQIVIQSAPVSATQLLALLQAQLQIAELPAQNTTLETDAYIWAIYGYESTLQGTALKGSIALSEKDGKTAIVLLITTPDQFEGLNNAIFTPIVESIQPLVTNPTSADYIHPEDFTEDEVSFGDEFVLPATLSLPNVDTPIPAVVLVHGSGPNDRDETLGANKMFRDLAQGLASNGIAVLRYDKRTKVYGQKFANDPTVTIDDEVTEDALLAVQYLQSRPEIDPTKIVVIGHSLGAMLAPRIAEQQPDLAGIVMMASPARSFDTIILEQVAYLASVNGSTTGTESLVQMANDMQAIRDGASPDDFAPLGAYYQSLVDYDQVAVAQTLTLPMLILQGERDYQVRLQGDFDAWQTALKGMDNVTFASYPDLQHSFMALGDLSQLSIPTDYNTSGFVDGSVITTLAEWILGL